MFILQPHLLLGLISQIIKIQLLADLNLKKTPQLVELVDDSKVMILFYYFFFFQSDNLNIGDFSFTISFENG